MGKRSRDEAHRRYGSGAGLGGQGNDSYRRAQSIAARLERSMSQQLGRDVPVSPTAIMWRMDSVRRATELKKARERSEAEAVPAEVLPPRPEGDPADSTSPAGAAGP